MASLTGEQKRTQWLEVSRSKREAFYVHSQVAAARRLCHSVFKTKTGSSILEAEGMRLKSRRETSNQKLKLLPKEAQLEAKLQNTFDIYDADGSKSIDSEEFKSLLKDLCIPVSEDGLIEEFEKMHSDRHGEASYDEFRKWYLSNSTRISETNWFARLKLKAQKRSKTAKGNLDVTRARRALVANSLKKAQNDARCEFRIRNPLVTAMVVGDPSPPSQCSSAILRPPSLTESQLRDSIAATNQTDKCARSNISGVQKSITGPSVGPTCASNASCGRPASSGSLPTSTDASKPKACKQEIKLLSLTPTNNYTTSTKCFDSGRFVPSASGSDFECPICVDITRAPRGCPNCHWIGSGCLKELRHGGSSSCPICRAAVGVLEISDRSQRMSRKIFHKLRLTCRFKAAGCGTVVSIEHIEGHEMQCAYGPVLCPFSGCVEELSRRAMADHMKTCPSRPFLCRYGCGVGLTFSESSAHLSTCLLRPVLCEQGCGALIFQRDIARHVAGDCPETVVTCAIAGCEHEGKRKDMGEHMDATMGEHLRKQGVLLTEQGVKLSEALAQLKELKAIVTKQGSELASMQARGRRRMMPRMLAALNNV